VGLGPRPPKYAAVQSASCNPAPAVCNSAISQFSGEPNPQVATGSLIYGNYLLQDNIEDSRADTSNLAAVSSSSVTERSVCISGGERGERGGAL